MSSSLSFPIFYRNGSQKTLVWLLFVLLVLKMRICTSLKFSFLFHNSVLFSEFWLLSSEIKSQNFFVFITGPIFSRIFFRMFQKSGCFKHDFNLCVTSYLNPWETGSHGLLMTKFPLVSAFKNNLEKVSSYIYRVVNLSRRSFKNQTVASVFTSMRFHTHHVTDELW